MSLALESIANLPLARALGFHFVLTRTAPEGTANPCSSSSWLELLYHKLFGTSLDHLCPKQHAISDKLIIRMRCVLLPLPL